MGILQARILEWIAIPSSRESSQPSDRTQVSCVLGGFRLRHQGSPKCAYCTNCCDDTVAKGWERLVALAFRDAQIITPTDFPALTQIFHQDTSDHQALMVLKPTLAVPTSLKE